jgi:hypothetical protein
MFEMQNRVSQQVENHLINAAFPVALILKERLIVPTNDNTLAGIGDPRLVIQCPFRGPANL